MENKAVVIREEPKASAVPYRPSILDLPPTEMIEKATQMADALSDVIKKKSLCKIFVQGGKPHVFIEGWTTLGAMLGIYVQEVSVQHDGKGNYMAHVELIRRSDGAVVGKASSVCGVDEPSWATKPAYARRSMAVTRAAGKAFRLSLGWIMALAGYEATPADEMAEEKK